MADVHVRGDDGDTEQYGEDRAEVADAQLSKVFEKALLLSSAESLVPRLAHASAEHLFFGDESLGFSPGHEAISELPQTYEHVRAVTAQAGRLRFVDQHVGAEPVAPQQVHQAVGLMPCPADQRDSKAPVGPLLQPIG